jgi:hypothetical protein
MLPARYSKTGHRVTEVDGWGTITTPFGTENCIRLVTTQYSRDTVKATLLPFPLGFQNNVRSYQWLTLGSKIPYLEITGAFQMENFTPTTARYRGYVNGNRTGLGEFAREKPHVYPSPAVNDLFVKGVSIDGTIRISNIAGALVREVSSSDGHVDVSGLHPGIYFIQLRSGSGIVHHRFVKE